MMLGDKVNAAEAERLGMIYKIFEDEIFEDESKKVAEALAQMPTRGLWLTKKALNKTLTNSLKKQLVYEDELQQLAADTFDFKEGVQAFLEKRQANFRGE